MSSLPALPKYNLFQPVHNPDLHAEIGDEAFESASRPVNIDRAIHVPELLVKFATVFQVESSITLDFQAPAAATDVSREGLRKTESLADIDEWPAADVQSRLAQLRGEQEVCVMRPDLFVAAARPQLAPLSRAAGVSALLALCGERLDSRAAPCAADPGPAAAAARVAGVRAGGAPFYVREREVYLGDVQAARRRRMEGRRQRRAADTARREGLLAFARTHCEQ
jgi:hypothetical protein